MFVHSTAQIVVCASLLKRKECMFSDGNMQNFTEISNFQSIIFIIAAHGKKFSVKIDTNWGWIVFIFQIDMIAPSFSTKKFIQKKIFFLLEFSPPTLLQPQFHFYKKETSRRCICDFAFVVSQIYWRQCLHYLLLFFPSCCFVGFMIWIPKQKYVYTPAAAAMHCIQRPVLISNGK